MSTTTLQALVENICDQLQPAQKICVQFDQSNQPSNRVDLVLKLFRPDEGFQRVLTLFFDPSREVTARDFHNLPEFRARISAAIDEFWGDSNVDVANQVRIC